MLLITAASQSKSGIALACGRISSVSGHKVPPARTHCVCLSRAILDHITPRICNRHGKQQSVHDGDESSLFSALVINNCVCHEPKYHVRFTPSAQNSLFIFINWATQA